MSATRFVEGLEPDPPPGAPGAPMTTARFRWCVRFTGWSQRDLAARLGVSDRNIRAMASGDRAIPPELADWLEMIVKGPKGWRFGDTSVQSS